MATFLRLSTQIWRFWNEHRIGRFCRWIAWENSRHSATTPLVPPTKWRLRNEGRNSKLTTRLYPDLGSASDWPCGVGNLLQPIKSTTQIWVVTRHQYGISALVSHTSFRRGSGGGVAECRLFPQVCRWSALQSSCNRRWFECQGNEDVCTIAKSRQCCPGPRTFRQWDFFSLGAIKLLMKAERDGGIPVLVRLLELSVVLANDICFDKTKNWLTFFTKKN